MNPIILAIVLSTLPLVLLGAAAGLRRRALVAGLIVLLTWLGGLIGGLLAWSDLWVLPTSSGMGDVLILLVLWSILGAVLRAGGPLFIPGPPMLVALVSGAVLGEVPAAAILAAGAQTRGGAARLALAAAGGGLIGRMGDPAVLLMSARDPSVLLYLAPLGVLLALLAAPRRQDLNAAAGVQMRRLVPLIAVAVVACIPGAALWALFCGIAIGLYQARTNLQRIELGYVGWMVSAMCLGLIAIAGGAPEMAATGLELVGEQMGSLGAPALTLAGAVLAALTDGTAAAVCGLGVLDRAMSIQVDGATLGLTCGLAVGGLGPLIAAGALRAGWKRWLLQVVVAVVFVWVFAP